MRMSLPKERREPGLTRTSLILPSPGPWNSNTSILYSWQNLKVCFNDIFDISYFLIQIIIYKYRRSSSTMIYWVYSGIEIYYYKNNMARCVTTGATFRYNKKRLTNAKRYIIARLCSAIKFTSVSDPDSITSVDPYPDTESGSKSRSESRRAKMTHN
jgi:hypothetical protein